MSNFLTRYYDWLIVFTLSLLITWPIFLPGYFSHQDNIQVMRIFEMKQCLLDLQIPCRWTADTGFGFGSPLFNYYGVFPYYLGALASLIVGFVGAAKLLFFIPLVVGGLAMYILGRELFGKNGGLVAAILYFLAPYRAVDTYIRGAIAESFAMAIIPLVFYFSLRLLKQNSARNFLGLSATLAMFLTSHNISTLFFLPVLLLWVVSWLFWGKYQHYYQIVLSVILGIGLAGFFIIPAFFEKSLVQIENLLKFNLDFRANFVSLEQLLFDRVWGYGLNSSDRISLQIGWPHWWVVLGALFFMVTSLVKNKRLYKLPLLLTTIFLVSTFMIHNRSAFIWERIGILQYAQFPWRFLSLVIFSASLLWGFFITAVQNKYQPFFLVMVIIFTVFFNWVYFRPQQFYFNLKDENELGGIRWEEQQKAAVLDYLPKTAMAPFQKAENKPLVLVGKANFWDFQKTSHSWQFGVEVDEKSRVAVPVFDFPDWEVKANGVFVPSDNQNQLGLISFYLDQGTYIVQGEFKDTPLRQVSNAVSIISLLFLMFVSVGHGRKILFKI